MSEMTGRERAEALLIHYLRAPWKAAGLDWDADNVAEVREIVDALHAMVLDEIREHVENAPHLYPDGGSS